MNKKYIFLPSVIYFISASLYILFCQMLNIGHEIKMLDIVGISVLILVFSSLSLLVYKVKKK